MTQKDKLEDVYKGFKEIQTYSAASTTFKLVESIMDWRAIGKAKHYVGKYQEAIDAFAKEKEMIEKEKSEANKKAKERIREAEREGDQEKIAAEKKHNKDFQEALRQDLCKNLLHLGHSHAGRNDFPEAIFCYEKIDSYQTFRDLNVQLPLSKAHAYRDMEKFDKALEQCKEACKNSGLSDMPIKKILSPGVRPVTVRCYWEAMYEKANCHTAKGEYPEAAKLYKKAIELYEELPAKERQGILDMQAL